MRAAHHKKHVKKYFHEHPRDSGRYQLAFLQKTGQLNFSADGQWPADSTFPENFFPLLGKTHLRLMTARQDFLKTKKNA